MIEGSEKQTIFGICDKNNSYNQDVMYIWVVIRRTHILIFCSGLTLYNAGSVTYVISWGGRGFKLSQILGFITWPICHLVTKTWFQITI